MSARGMVAAVARLALAQPTWTAAVAQALDVEETIARVKLSIVAVGTFQRTRSPAFQFLGTGFAVGDGALVVTNAHVLPSSVDASRREHVAVLVPAADRSGGRSVGPHIREARIGACDQAHDLAVLRIDGAPLPPLTIGDSATASPIRATAEAWSTRRAEP